MLRRLASRGGSLVGSGRSVGVGSGGYWGGSGGFGGGGFWESRGWVLGGALGLGLGMGGVVGLEEEKKRRKSTWEAEERPDLDLSSMRIFSGNANIDLAKDVAALVGKDLGKMTVGRFADGEVSVAVNENVRGRDVYVVQPTCPPGNDHLVELLLMISCMRRASAQTITAVMPYYGYARQDRKLRARVPISAADIARLLESVGVDRVISVDLHCGQIQGFFGPRVPVDNLDGGNVGVGYFAQMHDLRDPVIVSPDAGGVYRAKNFREGLSFATDGAADAGLAMIIKQRVRANEVDRMDLVGTVEGSDVILVDDMLDTGGSICKAATTLREKGARRIFAFVSHGLFSGPAIDRIERSCLEQVVVLNTVPLPPRAKTCTKIKQLSVAPLLAETIRRVHSQSSVSDLFNYSSK